MAGGMEVRKARLKDAEAIANFVNRAHPDSAVTRLSVSERFSQVGFMIAEEAQQMTGLIGFQVDNLVIRVTDFLLAPGVDRVAVGRALVAAMEAAGVELQAEAAMLYLPENPSASLISYWKSFGYAPRAVADFQHRAWREAASEWSAGTEEVVTKQLRDEIARKPM